MSERAKFFDSLYAENIDPWRYRSSEYERAKYDATLAALPRQHYHSAIEAGCSIGELSRRLSSRCDKLIGIDISDVALKEARSRNADLPHLSFVKGELPADWPNEKADLILLSEILYFLSAEEIDQLAAKILNWWKPFGSCILVNYLAPIPEPIQGGEAAERFIAAIRAINADTHAAAPIITDQYRIDILTRS